MGARVRRGQRELYMLRGAPPTQGSRVPRRSEEHTSELQSRQYLVCRLLLEKKKAHTPLKQPICALPQDHRRAATAPHLLRDNHERAALAAVSEVVKTPLSASITHQYTAWPR